MPTLFLNDNTKFNITLDETPVKTYVLKCFKHLQHVDIDFSDWDNPYYYEDPEHLLIKYANELNIQIDNSEKIKNNQKILNYLHEVYEKNYDGNSLWLKFHEQIHRCETKNLKKTSLNLEWREKGGLLNSKIEKSMIDEYGTTKLKCGDLFVSWSELGKLPFDYWLDGEPDDINRLCELARPWVILRPRLKVYLEDYDTLADKIAFKDDFNKWWEQFKDQWCSHWGLDEYNLATQFKVIKIGKIHETNFLIDNLKKHNNPKKISLK